MNSYVRWWIWRYHLEPSILSSPIFSQFFHHWTSIDCVPWNQWELLVERLSGAGRSKRVEKDRTSIAFLLRTDNYNRWIHESSFALSILNCSIMLFYYLVLINWCALFYLMRKNDHSLLILRMRDPLRGCSLFAELPGLCHLIVHCRMHSLPCCSQPWKCARLLSLWLPSEIQEWRLSSATHLLSVDWKALS